MNLKVGDILICKKTMLYNRGGTVVYLYNKPYRVFYVDSERIQMDSDTGEQYSFFFQETYNSPIPKRKITNYFYTLQETRKLKLIKLKKRKDEIK